MSTDNVIIEGEENVSNFIKALEESAAESKRTLLSDISYTSDNRKRVMEIIDKNFEKLSKEIEETTQGSFSTIDLLYLLERTKAKILTQLISMEFREPHTNPITPMPIYPYNPIPSDPTVIKPEWVYE